MSLAWWLIIGMIAVGFVVNIAYNFGYRDGRLDERRRLDAVLLPRGDRTSGGIYDQQR